MSNLIEQLISDLSLILENVIIYQTIEKEVNQNLILKYWNDLQKISDEIIIIIEKMRLNPGFANTMVPGPHYECIIAINTVFNMFLLDKDTFGSINNIGRLIDDLYKLYDPVNYDENGLLKERFEFIETCILTKHIFIINKYISLLKSNLALIIDTLNVNKVALISWLRDCHKKMNSSYHH